MEQAMRVSAFDPSSTCIGHATYDTLKRQYLGYGWSGLITPAKKSADPDARVLSMLPDVQDVCREARPQVVLVEAMVEKQYTRQEQRTSSLPVCGWAMGRVGGFIEGLKATNAFFPIWPETRIIYVSNTDWTRGKPKDDRQILARGLAKNIYTPAVEAKDKGRDLSDAICLIDWYLSRQNAVLATMAKR
jgi:hypothetical protein